ncbi:MAG TPA: potassium channel protein [Bryobacterales bacterium]|nr:potassium channel protein [Bryobacterales bacterium]
MSSPHRGGESTTPAGPPAQDGSVRPRAGRSILLLPSLLALILLYPVVTHGPFASYFVLALNAVVLVSAVYAVAESRAQVRIAVALAAPQFAVSVAAGLFPAGSATHRWLSVTAAALLAVFYAYAIRRLLLGVLRARVVGAETLLQGLSIYLLLGLGWASIFSALEKVAPGSFRLATAQAGEGGLELIYFSFVTLTTLGYGDITPLTDRARSLVILETITGQLYLAVMVARLVTLYGQFRRPSQDR